MKLSLFNYIIHYNSRTYLFNSYRLGLHEINENVTTSLEMLNRQEQGWDSNLSEDERDSLVRAGYVVDGDLNEHEEIRREREMNRLSFREVSLTIAPTMDCNFRCPYCFEGEHKSHMRMSQAIMNATADFAAKLIRQDTEVLRVTWFGGEPLMALTQIEKLTNMLRAITAEQGVRYEAGIISNGYGLTRKTALRLRNLGVTSAQVTVDGMQRYHDARRFKAGGLSTFHRVVDNIAQSSDLIRISVRVNLDTENRDSFSELVKHLNVELGLKNRITIYPAFMRDRGDTKWLPAYASNDQFVKDRIDIHQRSAPFGTKVMDYPKRVVLYCGSSRPSWWTIAPNGDLHKCWDTINSKADSVGNVISGIDPVGVQKWTEWSPLDNAYCLACKELPLCMGGCAHTAFTYNDGVPECADWKYSLQASLREWVSQQARIAENDL